MISSGQKGLNAPFLPITVALVSGIWVGEHISVAASLIALGTTVPLSFFLRYWNKNIAKLLALASLLAFGALLIHLKLYHNLVPHHISKIPDGREVTLRGTIYRPPQRKGEKIILYLLAEGICEGNKLTPSTAKVRISIKDPSLRLRYGHRLRLKAKLYRPRNFRNPGSFDYEGYLRRQGVLVTAYVRRKDQVQILDREGGSVLLRWFDRRREEIEAFLDKNTLAPGKGFLKALLIGERGEVPKEIRETFIEAGAVHILAISGLHLGIIVTLVFFCAQGLLRSSERILLRYDIKKIAAIATFPPLLYYILITGSPISTIRAGIMASCFLVAILLNRYRNPLNTLAFAAFLILLISPTSLWDPSFQLSFCSVLGIILLVPPLYRRLFPPDSLSFLTSNKWERVKRGITLSLLASFAAIVVTSPLVTLHFHRLSTMGLISNLIIIPLVGLGILPLGLLSLPFIPIFPTVGAFLIRLAAELSSGGIRAMEFISSLPFASCYLPGATSWEMILFYSFIATLLWIKRPSFRKTTLGLIVLLMLFNLSYWGMKGLWERRMRITFLDVGQGDCALVEFPRGKRMLIDGGGLYGDFDVGEKVVAPFLWKRRILRVDYLVLTHPQPDHYKGLIFVAQHFRVREFWHNGTTVSAQTYQKLLQIIKTKGIRMVKVQDGFTRSIEGARVQVLHPPKEWTTRAAKGKNWLNNNSLVLKISFGSHNLLFTGDIEQEAEARLLRAGKQLKAQLIKVPHHGSRTSSTYYFVKEVAPLYAVISLGFRNPFHFPSDRVVSRYKGLGCRILRTDLDGAIMVASDGKRLKVRTYQGL